MNQRSTSRWPVDTFQRANAFLIVLVILIGALAGWRANLAVTVAQRADEAGLAATLAYEESRAATAATTFQQLTAYSQYARNKALGDALGAILDMKYQGMRLPPNPAATARINEIVRGLEQRRDEAYDIAAANQYFFSTRFLLGDGAYDAQRDWQELMGRVTVTQDVNAAAHFVEADYMRAKSTSLVGLLMVSALAILAFSLAMQLRQGTWAYLLMALGMALTLLVIAAMLAIELDFLVILPNLPFLGQVMP